MHNTNLAHYSSLYEAAVILKSLPKKQAATILSRLQPRDMQQVLDAVKELDGVTAEQLHELTDKLSIESGTPIPERTSFVANPLVKREFSQSIPVIGVSNPFGFLMEATSELRRSLFRDEHPQNIAIVLSSMPPSVASRCMEVIEPVTRTTVLKRICELDEISGEEIAQLNYELGVRFKKLSQQPETPTSNVQRAANLISCLDTEQQEATMAMLEQTEPELAESMATSMATMDDLLQLNEAQMRTLLRSVDTSYWAPALKKAPVKVQRSVFERLADRPKEMLSREMAELQNLDPRVEQFARSEIISALVDLKFVSSATDLPVA